MLDAIVGGILGGLTMWYWGLAIVIFGMVCAWMGAMARAPIAQRNELRNKLLVIPEATPDSPTIVVVGLHFTNVKYQIEYKVH